jgi:hypothetical protein
MRGNSASFVRSRGSALAWNCVELILVANDFESAFGDTRDSGGRTRMGGNGEGSVGIEAMGVDFARGRRRWRGRGRVEDVDRSGRVARWRETNGASPRAAGGWFFLHRGAVV